VDAIVDDTDAMKTEAIDKMLCETCSYQNKNLFCTQQTKVKKSMLRFKPGRVKLAVMVTCSNFQESKKRREARVRPASIDTHASSPKSVLAWF